MEYLSNSETTNLNQNIRGKENVEHLLRLARAMEDPSEWEYNEEMVDSGPNSTAKCVCGHDIRYIFYIYRERDGKKLPIGSSCIKNSIPYLIETGNKDLAEKLSDAYDEFKRQINEAIALAAKRKREQTNNDRIEIILRDMENLIIFLDKVRESYNGGYIPYPLYRSFRVPGACSKVGFTIRRYIKAYQEYCRFYNRYKGEYNLPNLPEPNSEELK